MIIDEWFCTPIAQFKNENDFNLTEHCLKIKEEYESGAHWIHSPYNTLTSGRGAGYNIGSDSKFDELTDWIVECVNEFAKACGYSPVRLYNGWFNVYEKGDSQEFHNHKGSQFSCVYYLDVKDNDSKLHFNRSPFPMIEYKILENNRINSDEVWYQPFKGLLLVFKSDTLHMVERKKTNDIRISISYNFKEFNNDR